MPSQIIPCVVCQQPMKKVLVAANVEVDCCDDHGIWLDRNELQTIMLHAQEQAASRSPGLLDGVGQTIVQGAASGAGWSMGSALASSLVRRLFG
jgi:hypothetical protein